MLVFQINLHSCTSGFIFISLIQVHQLINKCSRSIINMVGQFQFNSTDLFSTAMLMSHADTVALQALHMIVCICSTVRVKTFVPPRPSNIILTI